MRDLGTFRGTNNPGPLDFFPALPRDLCFGVIALAAVGITVFAISAKTGFDRQARAYEIAGRV